MLSLSFHPSGDYLITSTSGPVIRYTDIKTSQMFQVPSSESDAHVGAVNIVKYAPNGSYFVSGGEDGNVHVHETLTGKMIKKIERRMLFKFNFCWNKQITYTFYLS